MANDIKSPPPKIASEVGDNALLQYRSVTYNIILTMMPGELLTMKEAEREWDHKAGITLIDTAQVGSVVTESLEITTANPGHPGEFYMSAIDHTFKLVANEPIGGKFPEMIARAGRAFNYQNTAEALYLLEINFKGYVGETDYPVVCLDANENEMIYKWFVTLTDLEMKLDLRGSTYNMQLVTNLGASSNTEHLQIEKGVQVSKDNDASGQNNIRGLVNRLEKGLNEYQKELVEKNTQQKADTYKFFVCPTLLGLKFDFASSKIPTKEEGFFSSLFTDGNIALAPGETVQGFVHQMFGTSPELVNFLVNDAWPKGKVDPKKGSIKKLNKTLMIVTGVTTQSGDSYDEKRKKKAVDVQIFIGARPNPKPIISPIELLDTASIDTVSARLDDYIENGIIRKAYKWIYTGENTEILSVDLKFNNLWRVPLPIISDQAMTYAQQQSQTKPDASTKITSAGVASPGNNKFRFAETMSEEDVNKEQQDSSNRYQPRFTPVNTQGKEKVTQSDSKKPEFASKYIFKQLHAGASTGSGDLQTIELDVLGDPYWLHQIPAGAKGPGPVSDNVEFYIKNLGNYKESIKQYLEETAGHNVDNTIYLEVQVPSNDRNDQDLMDIDGDDSITGVYRIFSVVHTFAGGKFTSKLNGTKDQLLGQKAKEAMQKKKASNEIFASFTKVAKGNQAKTQNKKQGAKS